MAVKHYIPASKFRARCHHFLDAVKDGSVAYIVTKRGRPVAFVHGAGVAKEIAWAAPIVPRGYGSMRSSIRILGAIVSPVANPDDWTADEHNL